MPFSGLCRFGGPQRENKRKWKIIKYLYLAREQKKTVVNERDSDTNLCDWKAPERIGKATRCTRNQRKNQDYSDYSIDDNGLNTEKIPWDLKRLAVTQTLVRDHQPTLVEITRETENDNTKPNNNNQQKNENLQNYRLYFSGWPQNKTERIGKER